MNYDFNEEINLMSLIFTTSILLGCDKDFAHLIQLCFLFSQYVHSLPPIITLNICEILRNN